MAAILTRRPASSDGTARRQFQAGLRGDVGFQLMVTWKARFGLQKKIEEGRLAFIHFLLLLYLQRKGVALAGTLADDRDVQECLGDRASRQRRYSCAHYYTTETDFVEVSTSCASNRCY